MGTAKSVGFRLVGTISVVQRVFGWVYQAVDEVSGAAPSTVCTRGAGMVVGVGEAVRIMDEAGVATEDWVCERGAG